MYNEKVWINRQTGNPNSGILYTCYTHYNCKYISHLSHELLCFPIWHNRPNNMSSTIRCILKFNRRLFPMIFLIQLLCSVKLLEVVPNVQYGARSTGPVRI